MKTSAQPTGERTCVLTRAEAAAADAVSADPALKPIHPTHSMHVPIIIIGRLCSPSLLFLRGPTMIAAMRPEKPDAMCTTRPPATRAAAQEPDSSTDASKSEVFRKGKEHDAACTGAHPARAHPARRVCAQTQTLRHVQLLRNLTARQMQAKAKCSTRQPYRRKQTRSVRSVQAKAKCVKRERAQRRLPRVQLHRDPEPQQKQELAIMQTYSCSQQEPGRLPTITHVACYHSYGTQLPVHCSTATFCRSTTCCLVSYSWYSGYCTEHCECFAGFPGC